MERSGMIAKHALEVRISNLELLELHQDVSYNEQNLHL
jgi:hypothetical protein